MQERGRDRGAAAVAASLQDKRVRRASLGCGSKSQICRSILMRIDAITISANEVISPYLGR